MPRPSIAAGRTADLRDMLLRAGVGQYALTLSIPYMNMLPSTCDPYAQGVLQLVQGLQNLLNAHGAHLEVDGGLGERTIAAIRTFSGPRWFDKSWAQLYGDAIAGRRWDGYDRVSRATEQALVGHPADLGGLVGDLLASPLPWIGAAAAGLWLWNRHTKARRHA